jgi:uncharacterized membrane protein YdjX (TVP38/TMEM64 family)
MSTSSIARIALAIGVVALVLLAARALDLRAALERIQSAGAIGPVLFVALYVVACVFLLPGAILTLGAGAVFGLALGAVVAWLGASLGATAAFLVGRYLARDWVAKKISGDARFRRIDEAVAAEGWKIVGLTRLSPVFPFNVLNYAFGLTRVSLRDYVLATTIGMIPGCLMYVYLGSVAGDLATIGSGGRTRTPAEWALYAVGLAATVAVTVTVTRIARRALDAHLSPLGRDRAAGASVGET